MTQVLAALLFCSIWPQAALADWISPTGNVDGTGWTNGNRARDGSTSTYASHSPTLGWGGWITLSLSGSIWSDRFRVMTDFGYAEVDSVQVEVSPDNSVWTTVHTGEVDDASWDTRTFTAQDVQYIRFRYHRIATKYIFWLYEVQVFETPLSIDPPQVSTTAATSVDLNSAIVHGQLDADGGEPCEMRFQYGLTSGYEIGSSPWIPDYTSGATTGLMISGLDSGQTYHYRVQARNSQATVDGLDATFICGPTPFGWVSPTATVDPNGDWQDAERAHDDESPSFAKSFHASGDPDGKWGGHLILEHDLLAVDSVRFLAKDDSNIDSAQIDISSDGITWTSVFNSTFANQTWVTVPLSATYADRARIRFHVASNGVGMYWELHEFDFFFTPGPVLDPVSADTVYEGDTLQVDISASDASGDMVTLVGLNLPSNAVLTDYGDNTGRLTFTPDFTQAGDQSLTIVASDGSLVDSQVVVLTVIDVNQPPAVTPVAPQVVPEGDTLSLVVTATDPGGDSLTLTVFDLPDNATFTDNGDNTADLVFTPDYFQAGSFEVMVVAADTSLADTAPIAITVTNVNRAPVLDSIGSRTVDEGDTLQIDFTATDPDSNSITLTVLNLPANAVAVDFGDGSGRVTFEPDFSQAGPNSITVVAADSTLADSEVVVITVVDINQAPVFAGVGPQSVFEGDTLVVDVNATDIDADSLILTTGLLPPNASFVDHGDGTGRLTFAPSFTQAGGYPVEFIVRDIALADTLHVAISVLAANGRPVLTVLGPGEVAENDTLQIELIAADPDLDTPVLTAYNTPPNSWFADNGDGTGRMVFTPDFTQAGLYHVLFVAADTATADSVVIGITVMNVNRPPDLLPPAPRRIAEKETITIALEATDPDGDSLVLSVPNLPANAGFVDHGNGTGHIRFTPDYSQAGSYVLLVLAEDQSLGDAEFLNISVTETNRPPSFDVELSLAQLDVDAGGRLEVPVTAHDPEGDALSVLLIDGPLNMSVVDSGNGRGLLSFEPDHTQAGEHPFVLGTCDGSLCDSLFLSVTVNPIRYTLLQNYPNPFNPTTVIAFDLPQTAHVSLAVYNLLGRRVVTLVDGVLARGRHEVSWNGQTESNQPVASGVYFYRLATADFFETRKMLLIQ